MTVLLKDRQRADFRDVFTIGIRLGEGAFGTVFECRKRSSDDKTVYAVKMMEHQSSWWGRLSLSQEAQWQMFAQEFNMMKAMEHPNLIRMIGVFIDDYFVYFVMDKYDSNLIHAVLPTLKKNARGGLSEPVLGEMVSQMLLSIEYMHSLMIIHRDVKADNYLVNTTKNFKGKDFKVVLTDLSTARYLEEGVFLKDIVGTKEYWAPELIARSYAHKVDVWAVGVVLWCILTMRFPFASAQERFTKKLKKQGRITSEQFLLIEGLLHKSHVNRLTPTQALSNDWVKNMSRAHKESIRKDGVHDVEAKTSETELPEVEDITSGEKGFTATQQATSEAAKNAITEKMKHADERFNRGEKVTFTLDDKMHQMNNPDTSGTTVKKSQREGESKTYEWWSVDRCHTKKVPDISTSCVKSAAEASTADSSNMCAGDIVVGELANVDYLNSLVNAYNVDVAKFGVGQAKTLSNLYRELGKHECCLLKRDNDLIRIVDLLVLRFVSDDGRYLIEASQIFVDGRERVVERLPAVMCRAKGKGRESAVQEITRLLATELNTSRDVVAVEFPRHAQEEVSTEITQSQSYPGLKTIYRKYIFNAKLNPAAPKLEASRFSNGQPFRTSLQDGTTVNFEWWDLAKCKSKGVPGVPVRTDIKPNVDVEGFQQLQSNTWNEGSLKNLLERHKIDTDLFGDGDARTLAQLATEVNSGETTLYEKPGKHGELRRYLEILIVRIKNASGAYLIETAHTFGQGLKRSRNLFPATKLRPYEDKIWAVRRLLSELDIPFANARTCFGQMRKETTSSPSYPNIVTIYLKQVVEVQLDEIDLSTLQEDEDDMTSKWYNKPRSNSQSFVKEARRSGVSN